MPEFWSLVKVKHFQKLNSDPKTASNFIFVSFNLQMHDSLTFKSILVKIIIN